MNVFFCFATDYGFTPTSSKVVHFLLINTVGLLLVRGRVDYSSRRYADVSTEKSLG